jgi:hypothetical protein
MTNNRTIDYHTFKNKLLESYPESLIDIQLVYKDDSFNFSKENGKVIYNHIINKPFENNKKPIGGYCVIKNRLGEFIELMNEEEILKCKAVAKMKNIWNTWESEMYLKTIIKRACKRFFYDIVKEIDDKDNEDYDLSLIEKQKEVEQNQNTPLNKFLNLLKNNNKTAEEIKTLTDEWNMTNNDIDLQRSLYNRIQKEVAKAKENPIINKQGA